MVMKTTYTVMVMFTLEYHSIEECEKMSRELYGTNRCYESYGYFVKAPMRKPSNFNKLYDNFIKKMLTSPF